MYNRNSIEHISREPFLVVCNGVSSRKLYMANSCKNSFILGKRILKCFFQKSKKGGLIILLFFTYYN